jgi:adenylate cyclase
MEIERKFLVRSDAWRSQSASQRKLLQFYLSKGDRSSVRVRIDSRNRAYLTVKSAEAGMTRSEFEYEIPPEDARAMQALAEGSVIEKTRHDVRHGSLHWEIDEFAGENAGLVIAEVELGSEDQELDIPEWVGKEVTNERKYYNASLASKPYTAW